MSVRHYAIKRDNGAGIVSHFDGEWVSYEDYTALERDLAEARAQQAHMASANLALHRKLDAIQLVLRNVSGVLKHYGATDGPRNEDEELLPAGLIADEV